MSRIEPLPFEQWDPQLKAMFKDGNPTDYNLSTIGVMAHAPKAFMASIVAGAQNKAARTLSPRLQELVRLRVAFHNQCRSCMAVRYQSAVDDGVTEGLVCSLEKPDEAPDLTPREKAALKYADLAATDHFQINDDTFAMLREHFTTGEIIELGMMVGGFIGAGRFAAVLQMTDALPDAYKAEGQVAPWNQEGMTVAG